jgi:hypothetical protein
MKLGVRAQTRVVGFYSHRTFDLSKKTEIRKQAVKKGTQVKGQSKTRSETEDQFR